ncbi:hypothetical protein EV368DRAFT_70057 [Lentinula lateritia]|uniref:Uncharacterized protein n=1 Tax=Lentinula aff. lateritia TaxID=2804960 RepID=A0ACC1TI81_9AGAR|nr:hypothetical protein F5876DRAFT_70658 [Lentinula aff. lateritia]KAJ3846275.1 hypothetical protein EV368DRAFT_70057 [Lentinula lateritia]
MLSSEVIESNRKNCKINESPEGGAGRVDDVQNCLRIIRHRVVEHIVDKMSRELLTPCSSGLFSRANAAPLYRMRAPSPSTSSSSEDSVDSRSSIGTASTYSSSSSSTREHRDTLAARYTSTNPTPTSSRTKYTYKHATEHILTSARNANIPIVLRHQQKRTSRVNVVNSRARRTSGDDDDDDSDYEQHQHLKKQKTKSQEQLDAEERRMLERKAELVEDPLLDASRMCPDKVWCLPCDKYIQIDSRRQFYATLWYKHRGKRHGDVPSKRSEVYNGDDIDVAMSEEFDSELPTERAVNEYPVALAVPVIDDAFASNILAKMYSKAKGLKLLSLAATAGLS